MAAAKSQGVEKAQGWWERLGVLTESSQAICDDPLPPFQGLLGDLDGPLGRQPSVFLLLLHPPLSTSAPQSKESQRCAAAAGEQLIAVRLTIPQLVCTIRFVGLGGPPSCPLPR